MLERQCSLFFRKTVSSNGGDVVNSDQSTPVICRVIISGRVQGVWYRAWTRQEAIKRKLDGWVRNRRDGTVEALFSGSADQIDDMILACREGPPMALVDDIQIVDAEPGSVTTGQGFASWRER